MAKQVYKIDAFHGGINRKSDPRDIADNELEEVFNASISNPGRITMLGDALATWYTTNDYAYVEDYRVIERKYIHDEDRDILSNGINLTSGYGLFSCAHDYTSNGMSQGATGITDAAGFQEPQPQVMAVRL